MTYSPITPQSQPSPPATQAQIQTNFAQFATIFMQNHTPLNNSNQGKHEDVIMENLADDPGVIDDLVSLYNKNAPSKAGSQPQLFAQILKFLPTPNDPNDAPNIGMQLTYNTVNTVGPNQFQSFLPGGYILYFGTVTATGTVTLSPAPSEIIIAIAMPNNTQINGNPNTVSTNVNLNQFQFDILSTTASGAYSFTWLAIGRA